MNKAILYGVAAVAGIGAAFLVFPKGDDGSDGASPDAAQTGDAARPKEGSKMVYDPESKRRAERPETSGMPAPGSPKDTEFVRNQALLRESGLFAHANSASPAWQGIAMDLNTAAPDLAAKCRSMSAEIRVTGKNPKANVQELIDKERALLEEVKAQGSAGAAGIARVETLIAELEAQPASPVEGAPTPASP